ncbi:hypothetical protein WN944_022321 [Citrus x changshan-huyou]|uniref:Uncharacterized protein n=1 Tax=Citrus x changshan-huyou TaxID=2935761 RepID=A0AAP0N460_9ROSI
MAPNQDGRENEAADFLQLSKTKTLLKSDELCQNTDNEFSGNKGQPEMNISQRNVPTRDKYQADTHSPKSGNTISRNHDGCARLRTVEGDTVSHVYPQCSSWSPMGGSHYPR